MIIPNIAFILDVNFLFKLHVVEKIKQKRESFFIVYNCCSYINKALHVITLRYVNELNLILLLPSEKFRNYENVFD